MTKAYTLLFFLIISVVYSIAQTNLIQNPGFEDSPATFTVPVGTPAVNHLMKVTSNAATVTDITQPTAANSITVTDGLWVKRQTVTSSSLQAYLAAGGANGSTTYLFLKIAGGNPTTGFDWTKLGAQQRVKLSNSTVYTFSFWAKVGNAVTNAYAYLADKNGDTGSASFTKSIPLTGGTAWTKYTVSFDVPAERMVKSTLDFSTAYIGVGINALYTTANPPLTQNNWLYVDDFELYATAESLVPTITSSTPENVFIKTNPIPVTITFNADVTDFTISDLAVTNGSLANFTTVNAKTYTVDIIPAATGKVTLDIAANVAVDAVNNARKSAMANQFVRFFNNETTTGDYSNTTEICTALYNKKAIYTFTTDDGFTDAAVFFNNEFKRLDLRGSLALVANWINGAQIPGSTYEFWNNLVADGRFDIINHSKTHVKFSSITNTQIGQDSLRNEIIGNQTVFRTKFPTQDIITIANPAVVNTDAADVLIKQSHYAARNGTSGYNSLSPTEAEWFKLKMLANYFGSQSRAAYSTEINKYVDNIIANKQWLILLTHGIGTGANAMQDTAFTRHFEYVASKRNDLWIAPLGDATKYIRQRQNANIITVDSTATRLAISLTHQLDAAIFDFPLTLKTKVPVGWTSVTVTQGTETSAVNAVEENGNLYVYYNAVPNGPNISLVKNATSSVSTKKKSDWHIFQPNKQILVVQKSDDKPVDAEIFNLSGKMILSNRLTQAQNSINISSINKGVYLLKLTNESHITENFKVILK
jgi:hypothetical protein